MVRIKIASWKGSVYNLWLNVKSAVYLAKNTANKARFLNIKDTNKQKMKNTEIQKKSVGLKMWMLTCKGSISAATSQKIDPNSGKILVDIVPSNPDKWQRLTLNMQEIGYWIYASDLIS